MKAIRSFSVVIGGPLILFAVAVTGVLSSLRSIARGLVPPLPAFAVSIATFFYLKVFRPWHLTWGSSDEELLEPLPGDEVLEATGTFIQHSIEIDAPANEVWPWVAQVGQDRGGFYSYEWLENMAGCNMKNADSIHPEWQERAVGETVKLHPDTGLEVTVFEPGQVLGLKGWGNMVVRPEGPDRCRVVIRGRVKSGIQAVVYGILIELPHFIMERKMLLEIKRLAEQRHSG